MTSLRSASSSSVVILIRSAAKSSWPRPSTTLQPPCRRPAPGTRTGGPRAARSGPRSPRRPRTSPLGVVVRRRARCRAPPWPPRPPRRAPGVDDGGAPLLDGRDEVTPKPLVVGDHLGGRLPADPGVGEVRELGGRVVAPDGQVGDLGHRSGPSWPAASWPGSRRAGSWRTSGRRAPRARWSGDEAVGVAGVADDEHPHVGGGVLGDGPALGLKIPPFTPGGRRAPCPPCGGSSRPGAPNGCRRRPA